MSCYRATDRCPECPGRKNPGLPVIAGDGPDNAQIAFIGAWPGREENNRRRPFTGSTGKEFNDHYLLLSGLHRDDVFVTNAQKCYTGEESPDGLVETCARHHLQKELSSRKSLQLIVPMGAVAISLFRDLDIEMHHGMLRSAYAFGREFLTYPIYHPALGLHMTNMMQTLRDDFTELGRVIRGQSDSPVDAFPSPDYRDLEDPDEVDFLMGHDDAPITTDTEGIPASDFGNNYAFYSLSFSTRPGTGYVVRKSSGKALRVYQKRIKERRAPYIFHNYMFDGPVLEQVDTVIPYKFVDDTMVRAYHLGNLPQGLKFLAFRLCGMVMQEFEDLVTPYAIDRIINWVIDSAGLDWPKPVEQMVFERDKNKEYHWRVYKPQPMGTKLGRILTDYHKNGDPAMPRKRWGDWTPAERELVRSLAGPMPRPSIDMVPQSKFVYYAARDADATMRVWLKLIDLAVKFKMGYSRRVGG